MTTQVPSIESLRRRSSEYSDKQPAYNPEYSPDPMQDEVTADMEARLSDRFGGTP